MNKIFVVFGGRNSIVFVICIGVSVNNWWVINMVKLFSGYVVGWGVCD